jgi:hypothetical protein
MRRSVHMTVARRSLRTVVLPCIVGRTIPGVHLSSFAAEWNFKPSNAMRTKMGRPSKSQCARPIDALRICRSCELETGVPWTPPYVRERDMTIDIDQLWAHTGRQPPRKGGGPRTAATGNPGGQAAKRMLYIVLDTNVLVRRL